MLGVDFNFNIDYNKIIGEKMDITKFTQQEKDNFNNSFLEAYFLGKGDHGTAYIYPSDDKKVVLITNEYKQDELSRLIVLTSNLKAQGVNVPKIYDFFCIEKNKICVLEDRIIGRYTNKKILHPETKEVLFDKDTYITEQIAEKIIKAGITKVPIRSVLTCKTNHGVCRNIASSLNSCNHIYQAYGNDG